MKNQQIESNNKDELSQQEIKSGVKNFAEGKKPHPALETADGKNNGAEPAAYKHQPKAHP
jgi:hypothetical protein